MSRLVTAAFFISGFTALVLEVVWSRMLVYVFGTTELALSTVLTAYMAGLALGSLLAGRIADKLKRPEVWYAACEAGIGVFALLIPWAMGLYPGIYREMWAGLRSNLYVFSLVRFLLVFGTLIIPTTLMGATLPLLARFIAEPDDDAREDAERLDAIQRRNARRTGFLYSANLLGACSGTAAAGLLLLPALGISLVNSSAAVADLVLALAVAGASVWWMRRRRVEAASDQAGSDEAPAPLIRAPDPYATAALAQQSSDPVDELDASSDDLASLLRGEEAAPVRLDPLARYAVLSAFACGGAAAMTFQVLWTRTLSMVIGSSTYAFTLILLCFLVGLGGGSLWASRRVATLIRPARALAMAHGAIAVTGLLVVAFVDRLPRLFMVMVHGSDFAAETVMVVMFVTACVPLLIPTFAMGTVFPITIRLVAPAAGSIGKDVGNAYAWNTIGSIFGSFASGFVVIVTVGLQRGMLVTAVLSATLGAAVWLAADRKPGERVAMSRLLQAGAFVAAAMACALLIPRWDIGRLTEGMFRIPIAKVAYGTSYSPPDEILFFEEGMTTTVTVERNGDNISLKVNGKVDASSGGDMPSQIFTGALGPLFHAETLARPLDMLVVGYGSGVSAGAALQFPLASIKVVEIEEEVYKAARWFTPFNNDPPSDPRFAIEFNDGRNFLFATHDTYDVIVSVPSNPWIAGVSSLFTVEYVNMVREHLRPGGVYVQWLQLYEISPDRVRTVMRTVVEPFSYVQVFTSEALSTDLFMVCSDSPLPIDLRTLEARLAVPRIGAELARARVHTAHDLVSRYMMSRADAAIFYTGVPYNTDDNLYLEFSAPKDLFTANSTRSASSMFYDGESYFGRIEDNLDWYGADDAALARNYGALARALLRNGRTDQALRFVRLSRSLGPSMDAERTALLYALLEADEGQILPLDERIMSPNPPTTYEPDTPALFRNTDLFDLLRSRMHKADWLGAVEVLVEMESHFANNGMYHLILGYLQHTRMRWVAAIDALRTAVEQSMDGPEEVHLAALYYLSRTYWYFREYPDGFKAMDVYLTKMEEKGYDLPPGARAMADRVAGAAPPPAEATP